MEERIRFRQEHGDLVRAGKFEEARKIMLKIKGREKSTTNVVGQSKPEIKEQIVEDKPVVKQETERTLDSLCKIKGIGKKTVKDIKVMFKDVMELKVALKERRVPLRDDVVKKLEEELI